MNGNLKINRPTPAAGLNVNRPAQSPGLKTPDPCPQPVPTAVRLPVLSQLIHRGDGTFILRPIPPDPIDLESWISVKQASHILKVERHRIYAWSEEGLLVQRRPAPRRLLVTLKSVLRLRAAVTADPDFWTNRRAQAAIRTESLRDQEALVAPPLQQP